MAKDVKKVVKESYAKIATGASCGCGPSCCGSSPEDVSQSIGYSAGETGQYPQANLGLGCGNPTALADIRKGETVLDLGSGAGFDAFLAVRKVGPTGRVIGVDITEEMVAKATENAKKYGMANAEFRLGDIEELPVDDGSVDVVISNCVINLAPDKDKVFREAFRVMKQGGRMFVSDIVLLAKLTDEQRNDDGLIAGCVGGALLKDDYLGKIRGAGFDVEILGEDKGISDRQYGGLALESLKVRAIKPA